jgi:hypothetical protein
MANGNRVSGWGFGTRDSGSGVARRLVAVAEGPEPDGAIELPKAVSGAEDRRSGGRGGRQADMSRRLAAVPAPPVMWEWRQAAER